MNKQYQHPLLPMPSHDDSAAQSFCIELRKFVNNFLGRANSEVYTKIVEPTFFSVHGRNPKSRLEVRKAMLKNNYHKYWSSLQRTTQELIWESPADSIQRQLKKLNSNFFSIKKTLGKLELDESVTIPKYLSAVDIHCMPGNYNQVIGDFDNIFSAALYDRGVYIYLMGGMGSLNNSLGFMMANYIKNKWPKFFPQKILDIGCGIGVNTLPFVDEYPDAEVYGIDVASPMLKYANARSEFLQKKVTYSQQNGERTKFLDNSFDLVMSHIVLHETSKTGLENILKETFRLLKPGGISIHCETPMYDERLTPYEQYQTDWDTYYNNEPFVGPMHSKNPKNLMLNAGFKANKIENDDLLIKSPNSKNTNEFGERIGGYLSILGAKKSVI